MLGCSLAICSFIIGVVGVLLIYRKFLKDVKRFRKQLTETNIEDIKKLNEIIT